MAGGILESIACPEVEDIFGPGGPVAGLLGERYCPRPGQIEMANLIRQALIEPAHAVIEAGTGIGKSFAYLIPALWSKTPTLVSTSNKALMDQLWNFDIPRLQKIAPAFKPALLKGRSNYVCALRWEEFRRQLRLPGELDEVAFVAAALERAPSGDFAELRLPPALAARLAVLSHECEGSQCKRRAHCWYEKARAAALEADLVVTNHALLCYSALLADNAILPVRPLLIVDEAHQLESYAIGALTRLLDHDLFWKVVRSRMTHELVGDLDLLKEAEECYEGFFEAVAGQRPALREAIREKVEPGERWALQGEIQAGKALWDVMRRVNQALERAAALDGEEPGAAEAALARMASELAAAADALAEPEPDDYIRFCEVVGGDQPPRAYRAQCSPLEVSETLRQLLFESWPRVVCTSATLSVDRDLAWFRRKVGLPESSRPVLQALLDSPYDYARQMILYTPPGLDPDYRDGETDYLQRLQAEIRRLIEVSQGRALVLCTSRRRMEQLYADLAPALQPRYPCYCQGRQPQGEIVEQFKAHGHAVIFATRSFWEGIDIPGEALSLVILDKIPFISIGDPVYERHERWIRLRQGDSFAELQVGPAILNLRQGAGRLIRSERDRGVIALLDSRVLSKAYGPKIVRSLAAGSQTWDFGKVAEFFAELACFTPVEVVAAPPPAVEKPAEIDSRHTAVLADPARRGRNRLFKN